MRWPQALSLFGILIVLLLGASAALAQDGGEAVQGTIFVNTEEGRQTLEGVVLTVTDEGGTEVGTATTDAEGSWRIDLPGPGTYTVSLDETTLPEGVSLRRDGVLPDVQIRTVQARTLLFPLQQGEEAAGGLIPGSFRDRLTRTPQLFLDGIKLGAIIAITAIGLSLIYGTTGLVNFSHGEIVTLGAVITWFFNTGGGIELHLLLAAPFGIAAAAATGYGMERGIWQPLRARKVGLIQMLVISIGLMFIIRNLIQIVFGGRTRPFAQYSIQSQIRVGPFAITPRDLTIILVSLGVLVAVGLLLQKTKIGKAMRAVADNRDLAESSGINVQRVILFVWVLGGGLAGFGGVLLGATEQVRFQMGFDLLLLMFAGVILGGIGTAYGAMVGSLIVGIVSQVSTAFASTQLKFVWGLLILIIVLLVRPEGILGRRERFG